MSTKWGGSIKQRPDGDYHCTLWKAGQNGGKGERVSWNQGSPVTDLHYTDQDRNKHSSDPRDWRGHNADDAGCVMLLIIAAGAVTALGLASLFAAVVIHFV